MSIAYKLIGFYNSLNQNDSFVLPIFKYEKCYYIQKIRISNDKITSFQKVSIKKTSKFIKYSQRQCLEKKVGNTAIYSYYTFSNRIIIGTRKKLFKQLIEIFIRSRHDPFLAIDIAEFLQMNGAIKHLRVEMERIFRDDNYKGEIEFLDLCSPRKKNDLKGIQTFLKKIISLDSIEIEKWISINQEKILLGAFESNRLDMKPLLDGLFDKSNPSRVLELYHILSIPPPYNGRISDQMFNELDQYITNDIPSKKRTTVDYVTTGFYQFTGESAQVDPIKKSVVEISRESEMRIHQLASSGLNESSPLFENLEAFKKAIIKSSK